METINEAIGVNEIGISDEQCPVPAEVESKASIPPLEVTLDEFEISDVVTASETGVIEEQVDNVVDTLDDKVQKRARRKKSKAVAAVLREEEIKAAEERLLERDVLPKTVDDFEKLVRSLPDSSFVWIKYMEFYLASSDVEKARSVAERLVDNVTVCQTTSLSVKETADELLDRMTKKFRQSCKVWLRCVKWMLNQRKDGVQSVVNRSLSGLPGDKHIEFLSQTTISEFKFGVPDRGCALFEGILREYPNRTDLWSVYLDQEIRLGGVGIIRSLFERATSLSLPLKKMKFLFSKYLKNEKGIGDDERIHHVKRKAMEYANII